MGKSVGDTFTITIGAARASAGITFMARHRSNIQTGPASADQSIAGRAGSIPLPMTNRASELLLTSAHGTFFHGHVLRKR